MAQYLLELLAYSQLVRITKNSVSVSENFDLRVPELCFKREQVYIPEIGRPNEIVFVKAL